MAANTSLYSIGLSIYISRYFCLLVYIDKGIRVLRFVHVAMVGRGRRSLDGGPGASLHRELTHDFCLCVLAGKFLANLSKVYRYIIQNLKRHKIPIGEGIAFPDAYLYLIEMCYGKAVVV